MLMLFILKRIELIMSFNRIDRERKDDDDDDDDGWFDQFYK